MRRALIASCLVGCLGCAGTRAVTHDLAQSPTTVSPATVSPATVSPATVSAATVSAATVSAAAVSEHRPATQTVAWVGKAAKTETHPVYPHLAVEQAAASDDEPVRVLPTAYTSADEQTITSSGALTRETSHSSSDGHGAPEHE